MKDNIMHDIPTFFEKNLGQYDKDVQFIIRQSNMVTYFLKNEIILNLNNDKEQIIRIILDNIKSETIVKGMNELIGKMNFLIGKTEDEYILDIPLYEKIIYEEVYPGIDMIVYINNKNLEYDFIVNPYSNFEDIQFTFEGHEEFTIDRDGSIQLIIKEESVKILKPKMYQKKKEQMIDIKGKFVLKEVNKVGFKVEEYDKEKTLIIDPEIVYSSYLGGDLATYGNGVVVDENQVAYITGYTTSLTGFPIKNPYQSARLGNTNAYILKIDTKQSGTNSLLYGTYIGGTATYFSVPGYAIGTSIDIDEYENIYITGYTNFSEGFPIKNAYQSTLSNITSNSRNAFLTKINPNYPGQLMYSTYLGGRNC